MTLFRPFKATAIFLIGIILTAPIYIIYNERIKPTEPIINGTGFVARLDSISTKTWLTYRSEDDFELQYPSNWKALHCGRRDADGEFYIVGPLDGGTSCDWLFTAAISIRTGIKYGSSEYSDIYNRIIYSARMTGSVEINNLHGVRYFDALGGPARFSYFDGFLLRSKNDYININFNPDLLDDLVAEKIASTLTAI